MKDMATTDFIAAIELSSSKISGIAGKKNSDGSIQVLAYACEDASPFIHKGAIYNIDKAAQALTSIINKLEGQLNNSIAKVYVGIGGQSLRTVRNAVSRTLEEESIISQELVDEICDENRDVPLVDMSVLDVAPQEYKIDNTLHVEPVGVAGRYITGQFLNIVARASLKKNLEHSFEQAKVEIADDLLVAPTALAKAVLTENEMRSGCALVDFGADTTTVLVYKNNILRYLSVLPLGGNNITHDITSLSRCALAARAAASCSFSASSSTNMSTGLGGTLEAGCCTGFTSCRQQFSLPAASRPSSVLCMPSFLGSSLRVWTVVCTNLAVFTFSILLTLWKAFSRFFRLAPPPVNTTPEKSLSS
jgi:hypothetical protein